MFSHFFRTSNILNFIFCIITCQYLWYHKCSKST